jgi:predicted transcriptional regulator
MPTPTTLKVPDDLRARLAAQAEAEGKSAHAYMLDALKEKADRADRRVWYLASGAAALGEYERTGIAYAMSTWSSTSWESPGQEAQRPKPVKASRKKP